jgi:hypothetical protein
MQPPGPGFKPDSLPRPAPARPSSPRAAPVGGTGTSAASPRMRDNTPMSAYPPPRRPRRPAGTRAGGIRNIEQLLGQSGGAMQALQAGATTARKALDAAREVLPAELAPHLWAANFVEGEVSLLFESAVWATRARYAAEEWREPLARALGEPVGSIKVKVRPRS